MLIKGEVNAEYEALCHKSVPITTGLSNVCAPDHSF
jgi:hypothetical protein